MSAASSISYWSTSVCAWSPKSCGIDRPLLWGRSRSPKRTTIATVPTRSGTPTSANSKKPNATDPGVLGRLRDDHVDRRAGEGEQRAGVGAERERHQELGRGPLEPHGHHDDDRQQRRDRTVDADQRREQRDEQHHQHDRPPPALPHSCGQLLPRPGRDPGCVQALADDEERSDEDDGRVTEACERLLEVEHTRRPQRERNPEGDDRDREAIPDEDDHDDREDDERDRAVRHGAGAAERGRPVERVI